MQAQASHLLDKKETGRQGGPRTQDSGVKIEVREGGVMGGGGRRGGKEGHRSSMAVAISKTAHRLSDAPHNQHLSTLASHLASSIHGVAAPARPSCDDRRPGSARRSQRRDPTPRRRRRRHHHELRSFRIAAAPPPAMQRLARLVRAQKRRRRRRRRRRHRSRTPRGSRRPQRLRHPE